MRYKYLGLFIAISLFTFYNGYSVESSVSKDCAKKLFDLFPRSELLCFVYVDIVDCHTSVFNLDYLGDILRERKINLVTILKTESHELAEKYKKIYNIQTVVVMIPIYAYIKK